MELLLVKLWLGVKFGFFVLVLTIEIIMVLIFVGAAILACIEVWKR